MRAHSSLSHEQREAAVAWFEQGVADRATASRLGVSRDAVKRLYRRWKIHGRGALMVQPSKQSYSFEFKLALVQRHLAGESTTDLAAEFGLSSPVLVRTWVRWYRRDGEDALRPKRKGRPKAAGDSPPTEVSELRRLERENERLRAQVAYLGKVRALRAQERR